RPAHSFGPCGLDRGPADRRLRQGRIAAPQGAGGQGLSLSPDIARGRVDELYRSDSRRVLATLIRLLGDFDLAEEALQDAFAAALEQWPTTGMPKNPRAWLISAGRFQAIDHIRRRVRHDASLEELARRMERSTAPAPEIDDDMIEDDRLRMIFTCCHPALMPD